MAEAFMVAFRSRESSEFFNRWGVFSVQGVMRGSTYSVGDRSQ